MGLLSRLRHQRPAEPSAEAPWKPPSVAPVGAGLTTDRADPRLRKTTSSGQQEAYLVLSDGERAKGFVQPVRHTYKHLACGAFTSMGDALAETYARDPGFYSGTFCASCRKHFPLNQFVWVENDYATTHQVGT